MAKVEYGKIALLSTGNKIIILSDSTLDPTKVVFFAANSSTEVSAGFSDLTDQFTGSAKYGDENLTKALTHYRNISGTKTKVLELTQTGKDVGEININVSTLTANIDLHFVAFED